jgi:hypothetical protein
MPVLSRQRSQAGLNDIVHGRSIHEEAAPLRPKNQAQQLDAH